MKNLIIWQY